MIFFFFFQAEDGIRDLYVTGVQTCALPIYARFKQIHTRGDAPQAATRGVQNKAGAQMPADVGNTLIEVRRYARRQTPAGHDELGRLCRQPQLVEASGLLCERQPWPGKDEAILLAGTGLVDSETLARRRRDRDVLKWHSGILEKRHNDVTGRPAGGKHG